MHINETIVSCYLSYEAGCIELKLFETVAVLINI